MYEYSTIWIVAWTLSSSVRIDSGRNDVVTMSYVGASQRQVDRNMKDRRWQAAEHYGILRRGGWSLLSASLARLDYIDIEKTKYRHADAHYIMHYISGIWTYITIVMLCARFNRQLGSKITFRLAGTYRLRERI